MTREAAAAGNHPKWMAEGRCAGVATTMFFPTNSSEVTAAIAVCEACAVRAECLDYALRHGIGNGIWGGCSERERRRIARRRREVGRADADASSPPTR